MDNTLADRENLTTRENLVYRLKRWFLARRDAAEDAKMLASFDEDTIKQLAQDNALAEGELRSLIRKGPNAADEMLALMHLIGIDPTEVKMSDAATFREMQLTCSHCREKSHCRRALVDGDAWSDFPAYCDNAGRLNEMRTQPDLLRE